MRAQTIRRTMPARCTGLVVGGVAGALVIGCWSPPDPSSYGAGVHAGTLQTTCRGLTARGAMLAEVATTLGPIDGTSTFTEAGVVRRHVPPPGDGIPPIVRVLYDDLDRVVMTDADAGKPPRWPGLGDLRSIAPSSADYRVELQPAGNAYLMSLELDETSVTVLLEDIESGQRTEPRKVPFDEVYSTSRDNLGTWQVANVVSLTLDILEPTRLEQWDDSATAVLKSSSGGVEIRTSWFEGDVVRAFGRVVVTSSITESPGPLPIALTMRDANGSITYTRVDRPPAPNCGAGVGQ